MYCDTEYAINVATMRKHIMNKCVLYKQAKPNIIIDSQTQSTVQDGIETNNNKTINNPVNKEETNTRKINSNVSNDMKTNVVDDTKTNDRFTHTHPKTNDLFAQLKANDSLEHLISNEPLHCQKTNEFVHINSNKRLDNIVSNEPSDSLKTKKNMQCFFLPLLSQADLEYAMMLLAQFIFHAALPFAIVEDEYFRKFCEFLRPGFKFPSRNDIATKYLDTEYTKTKLLLFEKLKSVCQCTLSVDGSDDQCNESLSNVVALCPHPHLLGTIRFDEESQTADRILIEIDDIKKEVENIGIRVNCIITDNENKMKSLRSKFVDKYVASMAIP